MSNRIEQIKKALKAGAKATKYRVTFSFPAEVDRTLELQDYSTLCKATSFPGLSIGQIEVYNQGRKLPIPGDTSYETTWDTTFYMDSSHQIRKDILSWMKAIDNPQANTHSGVPASLFVTMSVEQLDSLEKPVAEYTFLDVWPKDIRSADVASDSLDTLLEFSVTWSFSQWLVEDMQGSVWNMPQDGRQASLNTVAPDQD